MSNNCSKYQKHCPHEEAGISGIPIPGDQAAVADQLIFQPCAFIRDKSFHSYRLLFLSAIIAAGGIAEIECMNGKKAPPWDFSQDGAFLFGSERTLHGEAAAEEVCVRPIPVMVEARRIELLSENRSAQLSPGAVRRFLFPEEAAPDAAFLSVSL